MRRLYIALLSLAPTLGDCAVIELVCSSSKSEFLEKQQSYISQESSSCESGKSSSCSIVEALRTGLARCVESDETSCQQYTFKFAVPSDGQLGESPAESFFKACGTPGKPSGAQTTVSGSPDRLTVRLRYPELSSPMVFTIDRETLQGGFSGKLNYTCIKSKTTSSKKI